MKNLAGLLSSGVLLGLCVYGCSPKSDSSGSGGIGGTGGVAGATDSGGLGPSAGSGGTEASAGSSSTEAAGAPSAGESGAGGEPGLGGGEGGAAGAAGSGDMFSGGSAGTNSSGGSGGCGDAGQACCQSSTCSAGLSCLNGSTCSCVKALSGRYVLRNDGTLLYEDDPSSTKQTPVLDGNTGLPLTGVTGVQEAPFHGCASQSTSKTAWCWRTGTSGKGNTSGQLGNGMIDSLTTAFQATQVLTATNTILQNVVAVAQNEVARPSGSSSGDVGSACAVTAAGELYCWGELKYLTNGGTSLVSPYAVPVTTDGVTHFSNVLSVALHDEGDYACAITEGTSSKELWCWGYNHYGSLGLGDTTLRRYPTKVLGMVSPTKVRAAGYGSTCVLDGSQVRCWGNNSSGATGNGTTDSPITAPALVKLMGGLTPLDGIRDLHAGEDTSGGTATFCGLTTGNTLLCWGYGYQTSPTDLGVANVVALGGTGNYVRYVTDDGLYHYGTPTNHVGTTRVLNCGPLH